MEERDKEVLKTLEEWTPKKNAFDRVFVDRNLTVSMSVFTFSLTFREAMIRSAEGHLWFLKLAWICLGVATILGVLCHRSDVSALERYFDSLKNTPDEIVTSAHPVYEWAYRGLVCTFVAGLVALLIFAFRVAVPTSNP